MCAGHYGEGNCLYRIGRRPRLHVANNFIKWIERRPISIDDLPLDASGKRLAFGAVQRRATLDWVVARHVDRRLDPAIRAALHLGLYQLLFTEVAPHAAIGESVELAKPSPGAKLVNAVAQKTSDSAGDGRSTPRPRAEISRRPAGDAEALDPDGSELLPPRRTQ